MSTVNIHEAKARLSELVQAALAGREVVIARRNVPLVKLVPVPQARAERHVGWAKGRVRMAPDFDATPDDFADYT